MDDLLSQPIVHYKRFILKLTKNIFFILTALLFSIQITLQSIPIAHTIIVNGEAMCTCGCGHTVSECADNHGSGHMNCACEHDKDEQTQIIIIPNKIDVFVQTNKISDFSFEEFGECHLSLSKVNDQYINDVIDPPPRLS